MHSRLSRSSLTTKSIVLFTAPPASAWQLCLPVLYLIPPAKLALKEISLPDPWAAGRGLYAHLSCLGLAALATPCEPGGQSWSPHQVLFQAPGADANSSPHPQ